MSLNMKKIPLLRLHLFQQLQDSPKSRRASVATSAAAGAKNKSLAVASDKTFSLVRPKSPTLLQLVRIVGLSAPENAKVSSS
jgi:hypothetical protein